MGAILQIRKHEKSYGKDRFMGPEKTKGDKVERMENTKKSQEKPNKTGNG